MRITVPARVREAAMDGITRRTVFGRGGTSVGLSTAKRLVRGWVTLDHLKKIAHYFPRHQYDNLDNRESNGWIAWQLWGGWYGWKWARNTVEYWEKRGVKRDRDADTMGR